MDLYVVSGPFHLFESICLMMQENKDRSSFLIVLDSFYGASDLFENVKNSGVISFGWLMNIDEIREYSPSKNKLIKRIVSFDNNKLYHELYCSSPIYNISFERIYIAGNVDPLTVYVEYSKRENNSEIWILDDGLGHRIGRRNPNLFERIKRYINIDISKLGDYQLFFSPQLTANMYPYTPKVRQLKLGELDNYDYSYCLEEIREIIGNNCSSFDKDVNRFRNIKCLFLSNGFDAINEYNYADKEKELIDFCAEEVEAFAIKKHPSSSYEFNKDYFVFDSIFPLECLFLYSNVEKMLLISPISASLFNPKFVLDEEPFVALTYKLIGINNIAKSMFYTYEEEFDRRIELSLINAYKDKRRVCVPETLEELVSFIDFWKKETNSN